MPDDKSGPGRKTRDVEHATATQILEGAAIPAARLMSDLIRGARKRSPNPPGGNVIIPAPLRVALLVLFSRA